MITMSIKVLELHDDREDSYSKLDGMLSVGIGCIWLPDKAYNGYLFYVCWDFGELTFDILWLDAPYQALKKRLEGKWGRFLDKIRLDLRM